MTPHFLQLPSNRLRNLFQKLLQPFAGFWRSRPTCGTQLHTKWLELQRSSSRTASLCPCPCTLPHHEPHYRTPYGFQSVDIRHHNITNQSNHFYQTSINVIDPQLHMSRTCFSGSNVYVAESSPRQGITRSKCSDLPEVR